MGSRYSDQETDAVDAQAERSSADSLAFAFERLADEAEVMQLGCSNSFDNRELVKVRLTK